MDADAEEDVATARPGQAAAAIAVMGLAVALAVLPAVIGFGLVRGGQVAVVLGSLVAVVGGAKLAAVAWGLAARLASGPGPWVPAAAGD